MLGTSAVYYLDGPNHTSRYLLPHSPSEPTRARRSTLRLDFRITHTSRRQINPTGVPTAMPTLQPRLPLCLQPSLQPCHSVRLMHATQARPQRANHFPVGVPQSKNNHTHSQLRCQRSCCEHVGPAWRVGLGAQSAFCRGLRHATAGESAQLRARLIADVRTSS